MEQKIKQDEIFIGKNIRRIRKEKGIRQTEMVALLQLENVMITREALVKIERGIQHIQATQLRAIKNVLVIKIENEKDSQVSYNVELTVFLCRN
jgi:transcriptional regulator with XRE-family HTH domain